MVNGASHRAGQLGEHGPPRPSSYVVCLAVRVLVQYSNSTVLVSTSDGEDGLPLTHPGLRYIIINIIMSGPA